jgi:hypothetical protein
LFYFSRTWTTPNCYSIFSFSFCDYNFIFTGICNTPLERCFEDLSNGILQAELSRGQVLIAMMLKASEQLRSCLRGQLLIAMMLKASEQLRSWLLSEVEREADDHSH